MALLVKVRSMVTCPERRENVPMISIPLPFSAGNQQVFGGVYIVGADVSPKMSPRRPVVDGATPPPKSDVLPSCNHIFCNSADRRLNPSTHQNVQSSTQQVHIARGLTRWGRLRH
jgi:hypothetical protein